ncbi:MAG: hypothetical protein BWK79_06220 [Beggiatoa sp. IS2]|nr:MAG: hypothetical protein BWK79_06220 [Beggiatoa sp. IS2]
MRDFLTDFNSRVQEIEQYFEFVTKITELENHKQEAILFPDKTQYVIANSLQKILRANCYLLLYNLVESSIRNGVIAIYDVIHDKKLGYTEVNDKIQEIWLTQRCQGLTDPAISEKNIVKTVEEILAEVSQKNPLSLEKSQLPISGNLDFEAIDQLTHQYGFYGKITQENSHLKFVLGIIKKMRNDIAHGNVSFSESVKNTTMQELKEHKDVVVAYLRDVLRNIDEYLSDCKYKSDCKY